MLLDPATLAEIVEEQTASAGAAGAQVSVVTPDGRADVAVGQASPGRALTVADRVQVGSISKVLTAVLVHQLVDDGLLTLDDEVADVGARVRDADLQSVTGVQVGQLLSMTSGLDWGVWVAGDTVAEALRPQLVLPRRAPAGSFGYSFAGTMVAARLVEVLRGTTWWDAVQARIARPLGLRLTEVPDSPGHVAAAGWRLIEASPLRGMGPTGTVLCASAADLATIAVAIAAPRGPLLSTEGHAALHRRVVDVGAFMCADGWCSGPYVRRAGDRTLHGHGGRWAGGVSDMLWEAATGTAVTITTNTPQRGGDLVRRLSAAIPRMLWGDAAFVDAAQLPSWDPAVGPQELNALAGRYATATRTYSVLRRGDRLVVTTSSTPDPASVFQLPGGREEFVAVGPRRFLPVHEGNDERRLQEFWFSDEPVPVHCYDGFVAARRIAE